MVKNVRRSDRNPQGHRRGCDADAEIEEDEAAHEDAEDEAQDEAEAAHESAEDAADEADAAHDAAEAGLEEAETALAGAGDREGVSPSPQQRSRAARDQNRNRPRFQRPCGAVAADAPYGMDARSTTPRSGGRN